MSLTMTERLPLPTSLSTVSVSVSVSVSVAKRLAVLLLAATAAAPASAQFASSGPFGFNPTISTTLFQPQFADAKVHAGSFCQALVGSQRDRINTVSFGIENIGPFPTTVTCPVLRDNASNLDGTRETSSATTTTGGVLVRVRHPGTGELPCSLFSFDAFGKTVATASARVFSGGDQTLQLDVDISAGGGQYSILCTLPPNARLYNYLVREYPDTGNR